MRTLIASSVVSIVGVVLAVKGYDFFWIYGRVVAESYGFGSFTFVSFLAEYIPCLALYFVLAWLIAIVAKSKALEFNAGAGALANIYIAATAYKPKPSPANIPWSDIWYYDVYGYVPLLSVFPVFLLVGWLVTRRSLFGRSYPDAERGRAPQPHAGERER